MNLKKLVLVMAIMLFSLNTFARLPEWPVWTSKSSILKLDFYISVNGQRINTFVFSWPERTGRSSGEIRLGYIDVNGNFKSSQSVGDYDAVSKDKLLVNIQNRKFVIDNFGFVTEDLGTKNQMLGQGSPAYDEDTISLKPKVRESVITESVLTWKYSPFISLETPLELKNGKTADVIRLNEDRTVEYGTRDSSGNWQPSNVAIDRWELSMNRITHKSEILIIHEEFLQPNTYHRINTNNVLRLANGRDIKVIPLTSSVTKRQYRVNQEAVACKDLFKI